MTSLFPPLVVHFLHSLVDPRQLHGYSGVDSVEKKFSIQNISFKIITSEYLFQFTFSLNALLGQGVENRVNVGMTVL